MLFPSCFQSFDWVIDGKSDRQDFQRMVTAMGVLEITQKEQVRLFEGLAAILHLGNVEFSSDNAVKWL